MAGEAARIAGVEGIDWAEFVDREAPDAAVAAAPMADDIAYLQYSSGSTRFPHGVAITHHALLNNLAAHGHGMELQDERSLHLVAALVSRHGAGRLLPVADRQPGLDRLPQDRGFRAPSARLARHDQPQPGHVDQLFADLRLRHLRAPHVEPDQGVRSLRPVALAACRQRRRHDPARRDAELRRRVRRRRVQGVGLPAQLWPGRSDARGLDHAAGRRHPRRAGRGDAAFGRSPRARIGPSATARSSIAASRCAT